MENVGLKPDNDWLKFNKETEVKRLFAFTVTAFHKDALLTNQSPSIKYLLFMWRPQTAPLFGLWP